MDIRGSPRSWPWLRPCGPSSGHEHTLSTITFDPPQVHSFFLNMKLISFKWRDKLHTLGYAVYNNMTQLVISIAWDILQSLCVVIKWKVIVYIVFFFILCNSTVWPEVMERRGLKWCTKNVTLHREHHEPFTSTAQTSRARFAFLNIIQETVGTKGSAVEG